MPSSRVARQTERVHNLSRLRTRLFIFLFDNFFNFQMISGTSHIRDWTTGLLDWDTLKVPVKERFLFQSKDGSILGDVTPGVKYFLFLFIKIMKIIGSSVLLVNT